MLNYQRVNAMASGEFCLPNASKFDVLTGLKSMESCDVAGFG